MSPRVKLEKTRNVTRTTETLNRHPRGAVQWNAAMFEIIRAFKHYLSPIKILSLYLKRLKSYGVDKRTHPQKTDTTENNTTIATVSPRGLVLILNSVRTSMEPCRAGQCVNLAVSRRRRRHWRRQDVSKVRHAVTSRSGAAEARTLSVYDASSRQLSVVQLTDAYRPLRCTHHNHVF